MPLRISFGISNWQQVMTMAKLRVLRAFHVLVIFFVVCVFGALALYTYDETWFVGVAELVFYKLFGRAALLADNFERLWPSLILISIAVLVFEELIYSKFYKSVMRNKYRTSMRHNKQPKQIMIVEEKSEKELRKLEKQQAKEAAQKAKEAEKAKKLALLEAKKAEKEVPAVVKQPVETPEPKKVPEAASSSAKLNELLKNLKK